jgi:hypothetical protein
MKRSMLATTALVLVGSLVVAAPAAATTSPTSSVAKAPIVAVTGTVPSNSSGVQTLAVSPALACLATTWFTATFIYYNVNLYPDTVKFKGTACLNLSQSWGTSLRMLQYPGTLNQAYYTGSNPTYWKVVLTVTECGTGCPPLPPLVYYPHPVVKLYQVGTTWYYQCYDSGGTRFSGCSFSF